MEAMYRLQFPNCDLIGAGPYREWIRKHVTRGQAQILSEMADAHATSERPSLAHDLPAEYEDYSSDGWYCGCPTLQSLKDWFEGYWDDLIDMGFSVTKVYIEDRVMGLSGRQCFIQEYWMKGIERIDPEAI